MAPTTATYETALAEYDQVGASRAGDIPSMAGFCRDILQRLVGAASEKLVFEGALKSGMTTKQLHDLCWRDPHAVHDLMWI